SATSKIMLPKTQRKVKFLASGRDFLSEIAHPPCSTRCRSLGVFALPEVDRRQVTAVDSLLVDGLLVEGAKPSTN
ncbi:hypothetical protein M1N84_02055, partial [Dehalococcoidia bacterium]|nr:hypothetical protein [Dehalococcoidia bacterium]